MSQESPVGIRLNQEMEAAKEAAQVMVRAVDLDLGAAQARVQAADPVLEAAQARVQAADLDSARVLAQAMLPRGQ